jgi:hypothetical protein
MEVLLESRSGNDRRESLTYHRFEIGRRVSDERYRREIDFDGTSNYLRAASQGYWGASEEDSTTE